MTMSNRSPRRGPWLFTPLGTGLFLIVVAAGVLTIALVGFDVLSLVSRRIGIGAGWLAATLAAGLLGSFVNIPVARLRAKVRTARVPVRAFGAIHYVPALIREGPTTVAVNVGGAIVPSAAAGYLIWHDHLRLSALLASLMVAVLVFAVARPVRGVGILTPALLPPLGAALAALCIGGHAVPALAYVAGTIGTLVGADLLNLPRIRRLQAPLISIGGAGTFDGVFLAGLVAVLLASW